MNSGFAEHLDIDPGDMEPHNRVSCAAGRALDSLAFVHSLAGPPAPVTRASWPGSTTSSTSC